jgi:DNA-binding GntR family transcriptional regulator
VATIDRLNESGPIFKQLARRLAERVEGGDPPVGGLLPTEDEIAKHYGVSRHTVRQALAGLRSLGFIESRQGIGSIVVRSTPRSVFIETFSSVDELLRSGRGTPLQTQTVDEVTADAELAERLRGREGQFYLKIIGLRPTGTRSEALPAGYVEVYIDAIYSGVRKLLPKLKTTIAEAIDSLYGMPLTRIDQEITVDVLSGEMAKALSVPRNKPALRIRRWYHGPNGRVFEIATSYYPMGSFAYQSVLMRNGSP